MHTECTCRQAHSLHVCTASLGKLNFKLNFPLTDTINVPLSITWANKKALLQDESEKRGFTSASA